MVLRITRDDEPVSGVTLKLDGRLTDPWAGLLEQECSRALRSTRPVIIDLSGVAFVDRAGLDTLSRLDREGVSIRGCSDLVASILTAEGNRAERASD